MYYRKLQLTTLRKSVARLVYRRGKQVPSSETSKSYSSYTRKWPNLNIYSPLNVKDRGVPKKIQALDWWKENASVLSSHMSGMKSVLELGCGCGINLLSLAVLHPDIKFSGVELTEAGVEMFNALRKNPPLDELHAITGIPKQDITSRLGKASISVMQGDMTAWRGESADLVFTVAAIEQIPRNYLAAFRTAKDHARKLCVFIEEFREEQNLLQLFSLYSKSYFRWPYNVVKEAGLQPLHRERFRYEKPTLSYGILIAK